ncbi:uncharacterized protein LOC141569713 [Rhinolophus sinicus]|uniref:uncharacterized protein LOC141569713 n=1 Tax=Rhinolophus sinicus TaxID=89399 RepID=UPI003D7A3754
MTQTQSKNDTLIPTTHHGQSPAVSVWTETVASIVTPWPQAGFPVITWTQSTAFTATSWTQAESLALNSCTKSVTDTITLWTMLKTESKKPWTLPEASIFSISLIPQCDTTTPLIKVENRPSSLWTHPEFDSVITWALPESGTLISWIVPLLQAARLWPQPEANISRSWFKTQTESIKAWSQSESPTVVSTLTHVGTGRVEPLAQHDTATVLSWIQTTTGMFYPWKQSEGDTVRSGTLSEADIVRPWIKTGAGIINAWTHPKSNTFRPWSQVASAVLSPWTQSEVNTLTFLTQAEMQAVKHLTVSDINIVGPLFQSKIVAMRQGTQPESQIFTTWIQPEWQTAHPWIQHETYPVRFWTHPEGDLALWIQAETNTVRLWTHYESDTIKPWIQHESQFVSSLTEMATVTFWYPMQNDANRPKYQPESQMTCSLTKNEVVTISPWTQYESNSVISWTELETTIVQPWIHFEAATIRPWTQAETLEIYPSNQADADTVIRHQFQTQMDSIKSWNQPEANIARPWTQPKIETVQIWIKTEGKVVKPVTLSEVYTSIPWLQTQRDTTRPWIQPNSQTDIPLTQTKVGIIRPWTQQRADTNKPWTYPETQPVKPWINLEADTVKYWFQIQVNKVRPWTHSESQVFSHWNQPEFSTVNSWIQPETQKGRLLAHPETGIIVSSALPKPDKVRTWIHSEIKIKPSSHYKADIITSFAPLLEVEPEGTASLTSLFGSWPESVPFLRTETIPSLEQYFIIALSTEVTAIESQYKINFLQPSELTNNLLLTLSSTWLVGGVDYLNFGSTLQITKTKGSPDVPSDSVSPLSLSFSFLVPCSQPSLCTLSSSCSVFFPCTLSSYCIFPSCSILSPVAFSTVLFPLGSSDSSLQELSTSKFTDETILSHTFSSLHAAPASPLTKQPRSQFESKSNQSEQDPLKYSELNVSLVECRLGLVWKESLQSFWLFKTAVISHETTECGLRPGFVPHCPNCWEAEVGEFPWMVSLQLSFSHFCAGSILNEQWILTTAICANFIKNSEALALVQVGLIDLQDSNQAQTIGIHRAMPYLGPKGPSGPGLIYLKQPLHFQPLVLPICLEESLEQEKNIQLYDCWLPSWTLMRGSPGILQKRHLTILQVSSCAQFWPKQNEFTFCVEAKKAMGEAGCKGDLGAPLVCHLQQKDTWVQVGILSHFDEHCKKPYVFSQVSPFLFWLQGVTRPSHAPWSQQGPMTTSASFSLSVSTYTIASAVTTNPASIRPHFVSLPQPQTLADRISLRYAMPWQAMIISCGGQICSGSIVSRSWVLTAAHCVRNMNPEDTAVILGLRHPGAPLRVVKVSTILLHKRFRLVSGAARNDLALILLQEVQTPIQLLAPLGHLRNLNSSECWLFGPRILKQGETDENPEMLRTQVIDASICAHLYPDIGSSVICLMTKAKGSHENVEPVRPGSAVICRPMSGNGSWRQIGFTSVQHLATIVSPHFSWILSTSTKAGHPINQALMPWVEKPKSSGLKQTTILSVSSITIFALQSHL